MRSPTKSHMALFGNVKIVRALCPDCESVAFVIKNKFACCDAPHQPEPRFYKRECEPEQRRRKPSLEMQRLILKLQDGRCFYCEREFGSTVMRRGKKIVLRCEFDHLVPYAYSQNNQTENFVAACHPCNAWKKALMFQTTQEAAVYLNAKWSERENPYDTDDEQETEEAD